MIGPTSWSRSTNDVTIPKLPPPPRRPQNRSGLLSALAVTSRPSAVTTSAEIRLSGVSPHLRSSQPLPLPSVSPAIPVVEKRPPVTARPNACVSASKSPQVAPASARTVRASGSTRIERIGERSITMPSSQVEWPGAEWPPPRTATGSDVSRAKRTAAITSAGPAQRAISAG